MVTPPAILPRSPMTIVTVLPTGRRLMLLPTLPIRPPSPTMGLTPASRWATTARPPTICKTVAWVCPSYYRKRLSGVVKRVAATSILWLDLATLCVQSQQPNGGGGGNSDLWYHADGEGSVRALPMPLALLSTPTAIRPLVAPLPKQVTPPLLLPILTGLQESS